jgi:outer membrane protein assembly factor BamB
MKRFAFVMSCSAIMLCAACSTGVNGPRTLEPSPAVPNVTQGRASNGLVNWPMWGFDPARNGFNSAEHTLTTANVSQLREQWQSSLGIGTDSAPILIEGVGPSAQAMLFATTKKGATFGLNALNGQIIWTFKTSGGKTTKSGPAADPSGQYIYAPGIDGKVHKLTASNGSEIQTGGFPVLVSLMPKTELIESPLNVANGYLYVTLGGDGTDRPPYDGHIVAVNLSTGSTTIFNSLCSNERVLLGPSGCVEQRSGIWSRGGAVVDPVPSMNERIYVASGNGDFNANTGGYDYGDSVISLAPDLSQVLGSFTPGDYSRLGEDNLDLGTTSPGLLPEQPTSNTPYMLVQGGKDLKLRLINREPLPGLGGELQTVRIPQSMFSAPAIWTDTSGRTWVFLGFPSRIHAYRVATDASGTSKLAFRWSAAVGTSSRGTSPVVANGIIFAAFDGAIVALNATTGAKLWSSANASVGKTIGKVHFQSPIVVNGWVYCADQSGDLTAYALTSGERRAR